MNSEGLESDAVVAYIGLGSNLGSPERQVRSALRELDTISYSRCTKKSSLYRSRPLGSQDQPEYINAVAELRTRLNPQRLLSELHRIESIHGRRRSDKRWGPRTLDLDLLLYGSRRICSNILCVPHPGLHRRDFVLFPLREIAVDDLVIPQRGTLRKLLQSCEERGLERLAADCHLIT